MRTHFPHAARADFQERTDIMQDRLFCKIIAGDIPSTKVYEDDMMLAFRDIDPQGSGDI